MKANVLRGSLSDCITVHGLIHKCMVRRADAHAGGIRELQRRALPLLDNFGRRGVHRASWQQLAFACAAHISRVILCTPTRC